MSRPTVITVSGATRYDVVVGQAVRDRAPTMLPGASTVAVVRPPEHAVLAGPVTAALDAAGVRVVEIDVAAGEPGKELEGLRGLWDELAAAGVTRADGVVSVGGGATTDVAGFAAATWLRGVRVVHVPTTLLAMVDAAIGGKTGINTSYGKNLVGAFHPPAGVLVDLDVLATLPDAEWVNGMAEVVKAGFIDDPTILDLVESHEASALARDGSVMRELVERSIRMKARVVSQDLREAGLREMLNYGHTLGHAIERVEDFRMPHGHAVSVGLVFAAALGERSGRLDTGTASRHREVLARVGLPTSYDADAWPALLDAMRRDKKARGDKLRFIVLDGLARPGVLDDPDPSLLREAYGAVAR
jgi:3-dehydroquinate synthase